MKTQWWNGEDKPLSSEMLAIIPQIQGEGSVKPTEPHHTPNMIPANSHTPAITHAYRRRTKQPTPHFTTLIVPEPFGVGISIGALGVLSSPTRE